MSRATSLAEAVAARHRRRTGRRSALRLALAPASRRTVVIAGAPSRAPVPEPRLQLVLAPRITVPPRAAAAPPAKSAPAIAEPRVSAGEVRRLVERIERLTVRREAGSPRGERPATATAPRAPSPPAGRTAPDPRRLPLARSPRPAPAPDPNTSAREPVSPAPPRAAAPPSAAPADVARLTEHVLSTLNRRIVAERERRGRV